MFLNILKILSYLFICVVQLYFWTVFTNDLTAYQKEYAIEISAFLLGLLAVVWWLYKKHHISLRYFKRLFFASLLGIFFGLITNEVQQRRNEKGVEQLLQKMEKYKALSGQYPRVLTDLIPEYYDEIPAIYYGLSAFEPGYSVTQDSYDEFYLFVDLPHRKIKRYDSISKTWAIVNKGTPVYRSNFK